MSLSLSFLIVAHKGQKIEKKLYFKQKALLSKQERPILSIHSNANIKETPLCTSLKGSYTVEAAVVLPLFISMMILFVYMMQVVWLQFGIQRVMDDTSMMVAALWNEDEPIEKKEITALCKAKIAAKGLPTKHVKGDLLGLNFTQSSIEDNYVRLQVSYDVEFPIKIFGRLSWRIVQYSENRKWIGWDNQENSGAEAYVYITEYGEVYHSKFCCSYLHPQIEVVKKDGIKGYAACRACKPKKTKDTYFYITPYGESYHKSLQCIGLKRTIHRVPISSVEGMELCEKCSGGD